MGELPDIKDSVKIFFIGHVLCILFVDKNRGLRINALLYNNKVKIMIIMWIYHYYFIFIIQNTNSLGPLWTVLSWYTKTKSDAIINIFSGLLVILTLQYCVGFPIYPSSFLLVGIPVTLVQCYRNQSNRNSGLRLEF